MDQIQKDMVAAMKGKEEARLETLRMMKSALQQFQIDTMKPHDESTELQVLSTLVKQRKESADMFRKGNRLELAEKEESEIKMIETYMPSSPTEEESDAAVAAAIADAGLKPSDIDGMVTYSTDNNPDIEIARNLGIGSLRHFSRVHYGGGAACGTVVMAAMEPVKPK